MSTKEAISTGIRGYTLGGIRIFNKLEPWEREEVAKKAHLSTYYANQYIIRAGKTGSDVYFLVSGLVRANSLSISGRAVQFEDLREGSMFGEWGALNTFVSAESQTGGYEDEAGDPGRNGYSAVPAVRANDCQAIRDCVVVRMSSSDFIDCINRYPSICGAVLGRLAELARKQTQLLYESYVYSLPQRVRAELVRIAANYSPESNGDLVITEKITHEEIAQRIGAHREGVTIEFSFLARAKIITWDRQNHIIHDVRKLTDEAFVADGKCA